MPRRAFIVGGSGQIGTALADRLLGEGWEVTSAQRGNKALPRGLTERGLRAVSLDRSDERALALALGGGADLLVDTIAYGEAEARQLLSVQQYIGSLVVISSTSVYCDAEGRSLDEARQTGFPAFSGAVSETQSTVPPGESTYSTRKVALERMLLDQARRPIQILRPGAVHGPGSSNPREWWFVKRAIDGRRTIPLGWRGENGLPTSFAGNIAELITRVAERRDHGVYNITDPSPLPVAGIAAAVAEAMGVRFELRLLDGPPQGAIGYTPWSIPRPFAIDISRALEAGYAPVADYGAAVKRYCPGMARELAGRPGAEVLHYPVDPFDYGAEDALLNRPPGAAAETAAA